MGRGDIYWSQLGSKWLAGGYNWSQLVTSPHINGHHLYLESPLRSFGNAGAQESKILLEALLKLQFVELSKHLLGLLEPLELRSCFQKRP